VTPLKNRILKVVVGFFAVIGVMWVALTVYLNVFSSGCVYSEAAQAMSANGEYFAVYEQTICRRDPDKSHSRVVMGKHGVKERSVLLEIRGTSQVSVTWNTDHELVVTYPRSAVVKQDGPYPELPRVTLRPTDPSGL
jgi:hypothetical protein